MNTELIKIGEYRLRLWVDDDGELNINVSLNPDICKDVKQVEGNISLDGADGEPLNIRISPVKIEAI